MPGVWPAPQSLKVPLCGRLRHLACAVLLVHVVVCAVVEWKRGLAF